MLRARGLQPHLVFKRRPSGFFALEMNYLLMRLASAMVSGFGVLFIYGFGNDLRSGLLWVGAFFITQRIMVALSLGAMAKVVQRVGYRRLMFGSIIGMIVKLWLLSIASISSWGYLVLALIFGGASLAGYTIVFHGMFLDDNDDDKIGEQMGMLTTLGRAAGIVAPFFAGLLIIRVGFSGMFLVAMALLVVSTIPLWAMPHHKHKKDTYSFEKVKKVLRKHKVFSWSLFFWQVTDAVQWCLWPIYLYLILGDYEIFGIVGSIVMIFNSVAVYMAGKMYDKRPLERAFPGFSLIVGITWVMRFLSKNIISVTASDAVNRFVSPFWWMKIRRDEMGIGEKYDSVAFAVAHEYVVTAANILTLFMSVALLYVFERFELLILVTFISTISASYLLLKDRKKFYGR